MHLRVHKWALPVAVVVFAGFYASGHPHLRAEIEDSTASSTDAPPVIMDAARDPQAAHIPDQEFVFFEKERNLVLLPLENATDDADLDYLRTGLMRILADRLQSTRYLRLNRPERRLVVAPRGADWEDVTAHRYSRAIVADADPTAIERIILRVYARELDEQTFNILPLADPARQAFALKADYLITGSIESISSTENRVAENGASEGEGLAGDSEKSLEERIREQQQQNIDRPRRREADPVRVRLRLYDAVTAETREFHFEDRPANLYRAITTIADEMQAALIGGELVPVSFETPEPGAMVFLDDLYLGRTPLNTTVLAGQYALRVAQPDHHTVRRMVAISAQSNQNYLVRNRKIERRAGLKVSSDPPGARVYLNMDYLGETPLERTDLPPGSHRLRLSREGHVDRLVGVQLENGETATLNLEMQAGNTEAFYKDPNYAVLDYTYLDLSFYSLIGSTGFYAGFIYFQGQADRIRDSIRGQVPYLALWDINNFAAQDSFAIAYQWNVIQNNEARAVRQLQNANISARLGALGLVAAGIFLYLQLDVDADKEAGEFSVFYQNARVQLYSGCARTGRFDCFEQPDDSGDRGYNALGISLTF